MSTSTLKTFFIICLVVTLAGHWGQMVTFALEGNDSAGAIISNQAEAAYRDDSGFNYSVVSPRVTVTVQAVAALSVTPDEAAASGTVAQHERTTGVFRICNVGNTSDSYILTSAQVNTPASLAGLYFDNDGDGTVTNSDAQVTVNATSSAQVSPGNCLGVLAVVDANDSPANSNLTIHLVARSNTDGVNGRPSDEGNITRTVGAAAHLSSPSDNNLPPVKTINDKSQTVVSAGSNFTYTISFRNSGDGPARGVVVTDTLPAQIEYVAGSLSVDNRNLTDAEDGDEGNAQRGRVVVELATVAPGQVVKVSFRARLTGAVTPGIGVLNIADLTGQNVTPTKSSAAIAIIDPFGTVFSGRAGSAVPIAAARVSMLTSQDADSNLNIPTGVGFSPNLQNDNPYATDAQGHFSFALLPEQLGSDAAPAHYFMRLTAPGYSTRMLEITLRPGQDGLFTATVHALDGQPLARAGGFDLVREDVRIEDLASIALNIPMFEPQGLELAKTAGSARAEIGDAVPYRLEIHNPTAAPLTELVVRDRLPESFHYVPGSARLTQNAGLDQPIEPEIVGGELVFRIGELGASSTARILYRARIGANAREGEQQNVAFASGLFPSGERDQTPAATATVVVGSGVFSTRQIILGRVFVDANHNDSFDKGDKPVAGVRIYLNSGQSVVTDSEGLYNFPSLGDGPQVLSLDPTTVSSHYALADGGTIAGRSWTRLLRTPIGGGALLRQNFALIPRDGEPEEAEPTPTPVNDTETKPFNYVPAGLKSGSGPDAGTGATTAPAPRPAANVPVSTKIGWPKKPGVSQYRLQLATDDAFSAVILDQTVATNNFPTTDLAPGRYYWRVAPANSEKFSQPSAVEVKARSSEEFVATESLEPVAPGEVKVLTPTPNQVVLSPAMQLDARVALDWTIKLEVNGKVISGQTIGTTRQDRKNNVTTYTFVGIGLNPGPNRVRVTAIGPDGTPGRTEDLTVSGRGPARRLEVVAEKSAIQADGRDSTILHVRAFDQWGNPAADDQVAVETSAGQLLRADADGDFNKTQQETSKAIDSLKQQGSSPQSQVIVPLSGGEATVKLIASGAPGEARLLARMGQNEAEAQVRIIPETRPTILVGLADLTVGQSVPEANLRGEQGNVRSRFSFFYSGSVWNNSSLTVAYDSQRPINRTAGRDRLFQLDPLDRVYPLFGDSSTRYEAAQSNSKLYARLDHNRSYAMFGDFEADMENLALAGYARKLTGVKVHLENSAGDFVTVTGARPDTSFARDVFPAGGLGLVKLSHGEILPGSEVVALEVRDRRNPEIIISRETLARSVDYNLNSITGELFFLRYISTFDFDLNLVQLVVTYEHRASSLSTGVYTTRARKNFAGLGLKLGFSGVMQRQEETGSFFLAGIDGEKSLPHKGVLRFAYARSQGEVMGTGNFFESGNSEHNGNAYLVELNQPLPFYQGVVRARYSNASAGFLNPFGATVTPGSRRGEVSLDLKPRATSLLHFGLTDERNETVNVDNKRLTLSASWDEMVNERIRLHLGYDHRSFTDESGEGEARTTDSNLVTVGAEIKLTDKLQLSVKREQNLGEADPTFPNQTTLAATYQVNPWAKLFLTQRLASAPITPIADFSGSGFASTGSTHETAFGIETRLGKFSSMTSRYQLENGINGTDSFAVIGLQNKLPINKKLSLELGFERGFHVAGEGKSFNSATVGFGWQPTEDFRASGRYEFRNKDGNGQLLAFGAAGRLREGVTALSRFQMAKTSFGGRDGSSMEGTAALAIRPLKSDRAGLLFSFTHRSLFQSGGTEASSVATRDRLDSLSTDGYFQATKRLELYARLAVRFNANGQADLPYVSTMTYLTQERLQYRLTERFDWAGEMRLLVQPSSGTSRSSYGTEIGFWALSDLRLGVGYNFNRSSEPVGSDPLPGKRGAYFTISSKLSNLFDLFGTAKNNLAGSGNDKPESMGGPH